MSYPIVVTKEGVFACMKKLLETEERYRGIPARIRRDFVLLRIQAEKLARYHYIRDGIKSVTLKQIYDAICMTGELESYDAEELMKLESKLCRKLCPMEVETEWEELEIFKEIPWLEGLTEDFSVQLLAGAARRAVLEQNLEGAAKIGALFGGPILMPYVEWLLQRSQDMGFKRLYFIARDGYILKRMADMHIEKMHLDIETYYIHGSRRAWRMASYLGELGELRGLVGWAYNQHIRTAEDLADVLQMPVDKLRPYLVQDFCAEEYQFDHDVLAACIFALDNSVKFRQMLKELLADRRKITVDYLRQEIDVSDDNFAFVELGGGGFTQICLSRLLQDFYGGSVRTFFYKMDRVRKADGRCIFYDFFPSKLSNDLLVEMVCRAPEGQTEGYKIEGSRIVPIKKRGEKELYLARGYGDYVKGIDAFTEVYVDSCAKYKPEPCLRASLACMNALANQCNKEIMEFFGGMPNRVTGREENALDFAPILNKRQVQDIFVRYADGVNGAHYAGTDFEISLRRSTTYIQKLVKKYKKHGGEIRARWLRLFPEVLDSGEVRMWGARRLPYSWLGKRVVLYGAGKRGRRWHKDLSADQAIEVVQWLDKDYLDLKDELPVTGDMDSLGQVPFDWLMIDFANQKLLDSMIEELQQRGVAKEKIYYPARINKWVSSWITYLHV